MNAPRKVRCRQGHVYDVGAQPSCPKCGEGPAEAPQRAAVAAPDPGPVPPPRDWLTRIGGVRGAAAAVAVAVALILLPRLFAGGAPQALDMPNPLGLSQAALEAAMLDSADRALAAGMAAEARASYKRLVEAGNALAQFKLGEVEERAGNAKAAFRHYRAAAEGAMTIAEAQFRLGLAYENGTGTGKDWDKAVAAYRAAARQEHEAAKAALIRLAAPAQPGSDLGAARQAFNAKHYSRAFPDLQALAAQGAISANQLLGEMQFYGLGLPPDPPAAIRTFERGARNGYGPSQYFLGYGYAKGTGIKINVAEAYLWYRLARDRVKADNQKQWLEKAMAELLPNVPPGDKAAVDRLLGL